MNYRSKSKASNKIIKLALLALLLVAVPLTISQVETAQFIKSKAQGGTYYCNDCSRSYDHSFARWLSTTADCETGIVEGSQKYTPSCGCSAPEKPTYSDSAEYECDVAPYACSGCVEYKKAGSAKVFATWQSIYADCSVKKGSVRYSQDKYCAGSTRTSIPVPTSPPAEGSVTIATNITLSTPTFKSKFSPVTIDKSNNQFSMRMRVPSYSYNFFANIYLFAYPLDPVFHVPVKRQVAFIKVKGISDGQYHEYTQLFNTNLNPPVVEEIYIVFGNLPRATCANNTRENPCYLPMDIDYIRI